MKDMRVAEGRKEKLIHQMHKSRALLLAQAEHAAAYGRNSGQGSGAVGTGAALPLKSGLAAGQSASSGSSVERYVVVVCFVVLAPSSES